MESDPRVARTAGIEKRVLEALCQGTLEGSVRAAARRHLTGYPWSEPLHQAIFEIVMSLPSDAPEVIREQLRARLTRRGFPDADFGALFNAPPISRAEAELLMHTLSGALPGA